VLIIERGVVETNAPELRNTCISCHVSLTPVYSPLVTPYDHHMKQCDYCGRRYAEDSLYFCLDDGSALHQISDPEQTVIASATERPASQPSTPVERVEPIESVEPIEPVAPPQRVMPITPIDESIPTEPSERRKASWYGAVFLVAALLGAALVVVYQETRRSRLSSDQNANQPVTDESTTSSPAPSSSQPTAASKESENTVSAEPVVAKALDGEWRVTNTVRETSYSAYQNLQLQYRIVLDVNGTTVTGRGEKIEEGGRGLPRQSRTPIQLNGSVHSDRIEATFVESGKVRQSEGKFLWHLDPTGTRATGTFTSDAANSSGSSVAVKKS
jgi:hypothetical protein